MSASWRSIAWRDRRGDGTSRRGDGDALPIAASRRVAAGHRSSAAGVRDIAGGYLAVSVAYLLAASGLMIWRGIPVTPDYMLLLLIPVAALTGRFWRFMADWVPFVIVFLGWEALRGLASETDFSPHVADWASMERWLFAGHLPTSVLQSAVHAVGATRIVDYAATGVYFAHFVVLFAVAATLWVIDRSVFIRLVMALMAVSVIAFAVFVFVPVAPPWLAQDQGGLPAGSFVHVIGTTLPNPISPYYESLNPNRVAAFPSLHAAFPMLCLLALMSWRRRAWIFIGWCIAVWFSIVYLGEHYVVDLVSGVALALAGWYAVGRWLSPRRAPAHAAMVAAR